MAKKKNVFIKILNDSLIDGLINSNISYLYNFGVLLGVGFVMQIISGILCSFYFIGTMDDAFSSVEVLMRNISNGSVVRYWLANGVSILFVLLYILIFRNLYYGSYMKRRSTLFITGVIILLLAIVIAFLGYSLVCGIQSYWAIVVITNLLSSIRYIGGDIVVWIWSNYSRSTLTIRRFYSLLYLLRFIIVGMIISLIIALLELAGTTLIGTSGNTSMVSFLSAFTIKDMYRILIYVLIVGVVINKYRIKFQDAENNIEFNSLVTRSAIVRLWYLLSYYAILRSISNKLLGVLAMLFSILSLGILPFNNCSLVRSNKFNLINRLLLFIFCANFIILMILGAKHAAERFITVAQIAGLFLFSFLFFFICISSAFNNLFIF